MWSLALVLLFIQPHLDPGTSILPSDRIQEIIRNRLETAGIPADIRVNGDAVHAGMILPAFYEQRGYMPAWSDGMIINGKVDVLIDVLGQADQEGLLPDDYHFSTLSELRHSIGLAAADDQSRRLTMLADLDLLLTDAFLVYGSHLHSGKLDPEQLNVQWSADRRQTDMAALLELALRSGHVLPSLNSLKPRQPAYEGLRRALAKYRRLTKENNWRPLPIGSKLEAGMSGAGVELLRERLQAEGYLTTYIETTLQPDIFDTTLTHAVKKYQRTHGLDIDGVVGKATISSLNTSPDQRIRQIIVNMERYRWLPETFGSFYLAVNIADFHLNVVENDREVLTMRAIVGRPYRKTPVFSDRISYLVFNPYWNVPSGIARKDILPEVQKNPAYLVQKGMKVYRGWGAAMKQVDPTEINWQTVDPASENLHFRQEPGPLNALGRVKFMFPNAYNVYLHDTPSKELFNRSWRGFSSGCIRVEKAQELAEMLLKRDAGMTTDEILSILNQKAERTIRLQEPVPIHLVYLTAWVDKEGILQFRNDIYDRDRAVAEALDRRAQ